MNRQRYEEIVRRLFDHDPEVLGTVIIEAVRRGDDDVLNKVVDTQRFHSQPTSETVWSALSHWALKPENSQRAGRMVAKASAGRGAEDVVAEVIVNTLLGEWEQPDWREFTQNKLLPSMMTPEGGLEMAYSIFDNAWLASVPHDANALRASIASVLYDRCLDIEGNPARPFEGMSADYVSMEERRMIMIALPYYFAAILANEIIATQGYAAMGDLEYRGTRRNLASMLPGPYLGAVENVIEAQMQNTLAGDFRWLPEELRGLSGEYVSFNASVNYSYNRLEFGFNTGFFYNDQTQFGMSVRSRAGNRQAATRRGWFSQLIGMISFCFPFRSNQG